MHANGDYVKLARIGLAVGLALLFLPGRAGAEIVAPVAGPAALAVAPDGSPRVAFVSVADLVVAKRTGDRWSFAGVGRLPGGNPVLAGLVVARDGRASVLLEAENGSWIALAPRGARLRVIAHPRRGASFGPAGLALDAFGRPAVAYAERLASKKTYLRLVTTDGRGRLHVRGVTRRGFPASEFAPGAVPVLVRGRLHVVETYTSAAIDWQPQRNGGWVGQYLFASRFGTPAGRVAALAAGSVLWSAWTQFYSDTLSVLLTSSGATQETTEVLHHGIFVSLVLASPDPEVGAYDWADVGDWRAYAGVIAGPAGTIAELDGLLEGYAFVPGGRRQLLLATPSGLEWFESPGRPSIRVRLAATATGELTGRVDGASTGVVQLYRESSHSPHTLVATAPVGPDGSFAAQDPAAASPTLYRAVYVDPATGIPYASLLRAPVGPE
jgi:hypothetical protein